MAKTVYDLRKSLKWKAEPAYIRAKYFKVN